MTVEWQHWEDLPPEKEEEIIDRLARAFVKRGLGLMGRMLLESGGPLTSMFAEFYMGIYGPFFDFLEVDEYVALLRNKRNLKKLVKRINELEDEKERAEKERKGKKAPKESAGPEPDEKAP
ncbi:hypothetical protein A3K69_04685 [Candidatus Bathyarchaeota archaeon RBG_16_57_9]|jgi:hypothetical protein|nr:MAG: hypothetical protein A3K69_04685 [Candidatus Bathyarchaeota archaeon RBG_16_57_9]OGD52510.1 MAG: hypothetical protein A3K81_00110 [Candidatus Bathyarchaeota archaeon RBG_13_60_20]